MHSLAHLADDVADMIDEAIASKSYVDGEFHQVSPSKRRWRRGWGPQHQGWSRDTAEVTPRRPPTSSLRGHSTEGLTGERAISNLVPSEGNSGDNAAGRKDVGTKGRLDVALLLPWPENDPARPALKLTLR